MSDTRRWASHLAVVKVVYLLAVTTCVFALPAVGVFRPWRWHVMAGIAALQLLTALVLRDRSGDDSAEAPPAMREWAAKLEAKPEYVVSSTRKDFPWTNSHHIAGDLRTGVQKLKDATPAGVLLGGGKLATELDRLDLIDEYEFLVHPRIAGHGPTRDHFHCPRDEKQATCDDF